MKVFLLLICSAVTISGKIISGVDTIQMNYDFSFETKTKTANVLDTVKDADISERPLYSNAYWQLVSS
jgi:hypothetical protein